MPQRRVHCVREVRARNECYRKEHKDQRWLDKDADHHSATATDVGVLGAGINSGKRCDEASQREDERAPEYVAVCRTRKRIRGKNGISVATVA